MKIGILLRELNGLSNWQWRIIKAIQDDPKLELELIVRENSNAKRTSRLKKLISKITLGNLLLAVQVGLEKRIFFKAPFCVDSTRLRDSIEELPTVVLRQRNRATSGLTEPIDQIKEKRLDLLINLGFENPAADLINVSKNGIWFFFHAEFSSTATTPLGFSEVLLKNEGIGCTLLNRISETEVAIVDRAYFNRSWSMVESATIAQEGGVSLLLRNLKLLQTSHDFEISALAMPKIKSPGVFAALRYITRFYLHLWSKIRQRLAYKFFGKRHECWSVFLGEGSFFESSRAALQPLHMPKDEFWADPFLFQHQGIDFVFFENFSYRTNRGKISCGKVKNQELYDIVDVLDFNYHLSFPFIFEEDGQIYLMPETSENKRLEIYKAVDFPTKWVLYTTAFEGEMVADAFFYDDVEGQKWLFVNKQAAETAPMNSELFIYKTDSITLDKLQPHAQNPVIIDARVARNAGSLFTKDQQLYRPSQRNTDGIYGRALNINKVKKLTIKEYEEETVKIFESDFDNNLVATHHLHQTEDLFVFDAAYRSK